MKLPQHEFVRLQHDKTIDKLFLNYNNADLFYVSTSFINTSILPDIHETITMVRAETEPKTGTLLPFSPSEMAKTGTILKPRDLSNLQPYSTTSGAKMVAKANPEIYPDDGKKGREMTKEERESSTYTKEITAVVEDLDLAPKRRLLLYFQHFYKKV